MPGSDAYEAASGGPVVHQMFQLERLVRADIDRVWSALTDPASKALWFGGPREDWRLVERRMDVRPGGRETVIGEWSSGTRTRFEALYFEVAAPRRLIYAYDMYAGDRKLSVSLATLELESTDDRTRLRVTEQGAFLTGEDGGSRERGTAFLLDSLAASVEGA